MAKQVWGRSIMLNGSTPKAPKTFAPKRHSYGQSKKDYIDSWAKKGFDRKNAWESDVFKRLGM